MEVRLMGLPAGVGPATDALREAFDVISASEPRPDCGGSREVRVYLEVREKERT